MSEETEMRALKRIAAVLMLLLILFAVSVGLPLPDDRSDPNETELPPASVSLLYRDAEKIVISTCMRTANPDAGRPLATFRVDEVLDGAAEAGSTFDIAAEAQLGGRYLFYLAPGEEDGEDYRIMTGQPVPVNGGTAEFENAVCSIESIKRDIEEQRKILTVPSQSFFYGEFSALANACDEIVAARVLSVSEPTDIPCRSVGGGESTFSTQKQVFIRIKVENGFFGGLRYGDKLDVVLSPYNGRPVINATDLTPKIVDAHSAHGPKAGSRYVFFLLRSEDVKSDYYFMVNPYEGYVALSGNAISHPYYNEAFSEINDLRVFSDRLRDALFPPEPSPEDGEQ